MAITINGNQFTLSGGTVTTRLTPNHLVTLANYPAGTTQATVDSYITITATNEYTIKANRILRLTGYNDFSKARFIFESGAHICCVSEETKAGELWDGLPMNGLIFEFLNGPITVEHPSGVAETSSFTTNGKWEVYGFEVIMSYASHRGCVFWSNVAQNIRFLSVTYRGSNGSSCYVTLGGPVGNITRIDKLRQCALRIMDTNTDTSFEGSLGWAGGDSGTAKPKLLIPTNKDSSPWITMTGFKAGFQTSSDIVNITKSDFSSPALIFKDSFLDANRISMYPNSGNNWCHIQRTFTLSPKKADASDITDFTAYIKSSRPSVLDNTQYSTANPQKVLTVWTGQGYKTGTGDGTYCLPQWVTDDSNVTVQFRSYGYLTISTTANGVKDKANPTGAMPVDESIIKSGITKAQASTITDFTINWNTKTITVVSNSDFDKLNSKIAYDLAQTAQSDKADPRTVSGNKLVLESGWSLIVNSGVTLSTGTYTNFLYVDTVTNNGTITATYETLNGVVVQVDGLDPYGFGITWNLRYTSNGTNYTVLSGTGNTASITIQPNLNYNWQVRNAGYEWVDGTFNTATATVLNPKLISHKATDGSNQYLQAFDSENVNLFSFDYATNSVLVNNISGEMQYPTFNDMYKAMMNIQHLSTLVWVFTTPLQVNSTSQKFLIPDDNSISLFLSEDSNASVKITCQIVHQDTGVSADDRVKGNSSGYSIILGSPATADASSIITGLMNALGGDGYNQNINSLKKINDKLAIVNENIKKASKLIPASQNL